MHASTLTDTLRKTVKQTNVMDLWQRMQSVAHAARDSGHLLSIDNQVDVITDHDIPFVVRYAPQLIEKIRSSNSPKRSNPFLPPEPELFVEALGEHHSLILNKFNVLDVHGLIITNAFVEQTDQLTADDFAVISQVLQDVDGLIFYNGGERAGASQRHRHFQLVPKDMGAGCLPLQVAIDRCAHHEQAHIFPFQHRLFWLPDVSAETLFDAWLKLEFAWQPYNLLITRDWMLVVPRRQAEFESLSVNSLGFAGALLAKTSEEMDRIAQVGPMQLLTEVSCHL